MCIYSIVEVTSLEFREGGWGAVLRFTQATEYKLI